MSDHLLRGSDGRVATVEDRRVVGVGVTVTQRQAERAILIVTKNPLTVTM